MAKVIYLTLEQILAIHHDQVKTYGGSHGIRDLVLLESATQRPQASFMGEDLYPTIFDKAAALMHSLILNRPFIDGNKRTGTVSAAAMLHLSGFDLKVSQEELVGAALGIEQISNWLKEYSVKIIKRNY